MSDAETLYQSHLTKLRNVAKRADVSFAALLQYLIEAPSAPLAFALADGPRLNAPDGENFLIERYRTHFFEQVVNEVMLGSQDAIQAITKNLAARETRKAITARHKLAAIKGHSNSGGTYDKRAAILNVWATGAYASKDACAEAEHANFGMSRETARKALRNAPIPSSRASAHKG